MQTLLDKRKITCKTIAMTKRVLIVDDDPHIRDVIRIALESAGMLTIEAANGRLALTHLDREDIALVVLDVGMPEMDGFECCTEIRRRGQVPVLFLTARDDEIDRVLGFQLGADDFVAKPFSPRELVLRIKAILSRGKPEVSSILEHGNVTLDPERHTCQISGTEMDLTATEFALMHLLLQQPQRVFDRNQMIHGVYGNNNTLSGRTVDSHIRNMRAKAASLGCEDLIQTVRGVGVRLGSCAAQPAPRQLQ